MKGLWVRAALLALVPVFALGFTALAAEADAGGSFFASLAPLPCDASSPAVAAEPLAELDLSPIEELPVTPTEPAEKAVTCGSWTYNGCCVSQTKYRRRCQFNPGEWWYEYKCQGVCIM